MLGRHFLVATAALFGLSGCLVTKTTMPAELVQNESYEFSVKLDSLITYGKDMKGAPTLCVSAPEDWTFEAINYKGYSMDGLVEGEPIKTSPSGMEHQLPNDYAFSCWAGPYGTYDLSSHGKARFRVIVGESVGSHELTFVSGYTKNMSFYELKHEVEVLAAQEEVPSE